MEKTPTAVRKRLYDQIDRLLKELNVLEWLEEMISANQN